MDALDALRGFLKGLSEGPVSIEPRFGKRDALGRFVLVLVVVLVLEALVLAGITTRLRRGYGGQAPRPARWLSGETRTARCAR